MCANTELIAGVDSFLIWGDEATFGTAGTVDTHLGLVTDFNPKHNRTAKEHRGFTGSTSGGQEAVKTTAGKYEGGFSVDFIPLEWSWIEFVLGSASGTGSSADPFIYSRSNNPAGLTFSSNKNNVTTDSEGLFLGSRFESVTIRASKDDNEVTCSAVVQCVNFTKDSTIATNVALPTGEVFVMAGASIELPDSSAISHIIDNVEITINRNPKRLHGLGSHVSTQSKYGAIEYRVNFTVNYLDDTFMDDLMGSATTMDNIMTNNATLTVRLQSLTNANRNVEFKFTNVTFPEIDEKDTLNDFITEGITGWCQTLTVEEQTST